MLQVVDMVGTGGTVVALAVLRRSNNMVYTQELAELPDVGEDWRSSPCQE